MSGMRLRQNAKGFTLVELMITVLISAVVGGAMYAAFNAQHRTYLNQDAVSSMQSNIRAAMEMLVRDTRLAGYDWNGAISPRPRLFPDVAVVSPGSASLLHMTMDLNADRDVADPDEDIAYGFALADDAGDDGIADAGAAPLGRRDASIAAGAFLPMADNFQAVAYAYAYDAVTPAGPDTYTVGVEQRILWAADVNGDGIWDNLDTDGNGIIDAADDTDGNGFVEGTVTGTVIDPTQIRAVRIWLLARAPQADTSYTDARTYVVGNKVIITNDNFRRRLLETTVDCKNMGLGQ